MHRRRTTRHVLLALILTAAVVPPAAAAAAAATAKTADSSRAIALAPKAPVADGFLDGLSLGSDTGDQYRRDPDIRKFGYNKATGWNVPTTTTTTTALPLPAAPVYIPPTTKRPWWLMPAKEKISDWVDLTPKQHVYKYPKSVKLDPVPHFPSHPPPRKRGHVIRRDWRVPEPEAPQPEDPPPPDPTGGETGGATAVEDLPLATGPELPTFDGQGCMVALGFEWCDAAQRCIRPSVMACEDIGPEAGDAAMATEAGSYDPCGKKREGDTCTICPPLPEGVDCNEPVATAGRVCNSIGKCVPSPMGLVYDNLLPHMVRSYFGHEKPEPAVLDLLLPPNVRSIAQMQARLEQLEGHLDHRKDRMLRGAQGGMDKFQNLVRAANARSRTLKLHVSDAVAEIRRARQELLESQQAVVKGEREEGEAQGEFDAAAHRASRRYSRMDGYMHEQKELIKDIKAAVHGLHKPLLRTSGSPSPPSATGSSSFATGPASAATAALAL